MRTLPGGRAGNRMPGPLTPAGPRLPAVFIEGTWETQPPKTVENIQFRVVEGPLGSEAQREKKPPEDQRSLATAPFHPLRVGAVS